MLAGARSVLRFLVVLVAIGGTTGLAFAMFRAAHPVLITDVAAKAKTFEVTSSEPVALRLYADGVPVAEATPVAQRSTTVLPLSGHAIDVWAVRATATDGRRSDTAVWRSPGPPVPPDDAVGSRFLALMLGKHQSAVAATVTLPRSDERIHALLSLSWPPRAFIDNSLDVMLQPSPEANSYYDVSSFLGDTSDWETTYHGGDVTVHIGALRNTVPSYFPATDRIAVDLRLPWNHVVHRFRKDVVQLQFEGYAPSGFDPLPDTITTDRRYIWHDDPQHALDRIIITLRPERRSLFSVAHDWIEPHPTQPWTRLLLTLLHDVWNAAPIVVVAWLCRAAFKAMDAQHRMVAWSLAAIAFAPAASEVVNELSRLPLRLPQPAFGISWTTGLMFGVAVGALAIFAVTAVTQGIAPRACLAFVATIALVVVVAAGAAIADHEFYTRPSFTDQVRTELFWRDVGTAVTMVAIALLLWWTIRPYAWLRRMGWGSALALTLEIGLLLFLSWPFGREAFLPPIEPAPRYGGAVSSLNVVIYALASAAPLVFALLYVSTGLAGPANDGPLRRRRIYTAALVALFVVGTQVTVAALPLPAIIAFGLMWFALVNDARWTSIDAWRHLVTEDRARFVDRALDLREADRVDRTLETLNDQFVSGSLSPKDYTERAEALRTRAIDLRRAVPNDAAVIEQLAFGAGVAADDLGNGRRAGTVGLVVALGFAAVLAQQALALGTRSPAVVFTLAFTLLTFVGGRALSAFVFGYAFAHLRGSSGVTKATLLAAVQSVATLPVWLLAGSPATIPSDALAIVAFDVIVGFIAFDWPNLKFIRPTLLTPRRLIGVAGLQDVAVVFALFSGSIVSLLTGQVSAIAAAAIKAAFPTAPVPPVHP